MTWRRPLIERALGGLGLAAAMLVLVGRLASGMMVVDPQALSDLAALRAATVPCQAETDADAAHRRTPAVPVSDQGVVILASLLSQPSPILTPAIVPPPRRQDVVDAAVVLPSARGPPVHRPGAALPRGPPVLL